MRYWLLYSLLGQMSVRKCLAGGDADECTKCPAGTVCWDVALMYDRNPPFCNYFVVALQSLTEHLSSNAALRIHIMVPDSDKRMERDVKMLAASIRKEPIDSVVQVAPRKMHLAPLEAAVGSLKMTKIKGITGSMLLKLAHHVLLERALPKCVNTVLMIDTDIFVNTDAFAALFLPLHARLMASPGCALSHVFNGTGKYEEIVDLALVKENSPHHSLADLSPKDPFYGNGAFVANLSVWRQHGASARMLQLIRANVKFLKEASPRGNPHKIMMKALTPYHPMYGHRVTQTLMALTFPPAFHCGTKAKIIQTCPRKTEWLFGKDHIWHQWGSKKMDERSKTKCDKWLSKEWKNSRKRGMRRFPLCMRSGGTRRMPRSSRANATLGETELVPR